MTDYDSYLNSLMADCQRSVQRPSHQPQYPHIGPQNFATPPTPLPSYTFKEGLTVAPRPCISAEPPAIIAATASYTPRNVPSAAIAPQRSIPKDLPLARIPHRPGIPKTIPRPAVDPHTIVNKKVLPAVTAPRSAISGNPSPAATAPSPFVPLFPLPIASSISACDLQNNHESTGPIGHAEARQDTSKGCINGLPEKRLRLRYQNLSQDAMRKELKARGLICHGQNADLVKRLERDDEFQAKPRTAENYDKMNSKDIRSLCFRRFIPSHGTTSSLRGRLKAHDNRINGRGAAVPGLSPLIVPSGPLSTPELKGSREVLEEKPLVQTVNDGSASMIETTERSGETAEKVALAQPLKSVVFKPMNFIEPRQTIHKACSECRKSKRRCVHDQFGDEDPLRAIEPATSEHTACKTYIKDRIDPMAKTSTLAIQEVAPKYITRLRLSLQGVSASKKDQEPTLAINSFAATRTTYFQNGRACSKCRKRKRRCIHDTNGEDTAETMTLAEPTSSVEFQLTKDVLPVRVSDPKASASQNELRRPAQIRRNWKDVKSKGNAPKSRQAKLFFQPQDEITLLQICVKLKDVIAWGNISGFWNMVQDTLQLKTGKPYKKPSRHVEMLVRKRRAEQQEIEQCGKITISRVSAGCRPLLDKLIDGGHRVHHVSPIMSTTPTLIEDKDNISLYKERREQLDSDEFALEVQKRSATDAWLDNSCDTTRRKKPKLCTPELASDTRNSSADSIGCWSLSGSSVTSESSLEEESEDEDEDDVKG